MLTRHDINDNYRFPKRLPGKYLQKGLYSNHINSNRFHAISVNDDNWNDSEELHSLEVSLKTPYANNN